MIALVVAAQVAALAAQDRVHLVILRDRGVETCPSDDDIAARVRRRIGSEPFRDDDGGRELRVGLARDDGGLTARLALFSPRGLRLGVRVLHGDADCATLAGDLVLAIAIAIDPLVLVRAPPAPLAMTFPAASAGPPAPSVAPPAVPLLVLPGIPRPEAVVARGSLGVAAGIGAIATPSARAAVSFDYGVLGIEAGLRFDLPSREAVGGSALVDVALLAGHAAACLGVDIDANIAARGCGQLEAGGLAAEGVGLVGGQPITAPWFAVGTRGGLDVKVLPELGLVIEADVLSPLVRPRFVDDASGRLFFEPSLLVWDIGVGTRIQIR